MRFSRFSLFLFVFQASFFRELATLQRPVEQQAQRGIFVGLRRPQDAKSGCSLATYEPGMQQRGCMYAFSVCVSQNAVVLVLCAVGWFETDRPAVRFAWWSNCRTTC